MQNSVSMKLFTDGQHSFNVIRQGDLANEPGYQIRYQQEASKAPYIRKATFLIPNPTSLASSSHTSRNNDPRLNGAIARNSTRGGRFSGHQKRMACLR